MEQFDSSEEASSRVLEQQQRNDEQQWQWKKERMCVYTNDLAMTAQSQSDIIEHINAITFVFICMHIGSQWFQAY